MRGNAGLIIGGWGVFGMCGNWGGCVWEGESPGPPLT